MNPSGSALFHLLAVPMLLHFADGGSPAETGDNWSIKLLDEAVHQGAHPSARDLLVVAAAALITETMRNVVDKGFLQNIIPW